MDTIILQSINMKFLFSNCDDVADKSSSTLLIFRNKNSLLSLSVVSHAMYSFTRNVFIIVFLEYGVIDTGSIISNGL